MNQLGRSILVKFLAQTVDVNLNQVGLAIKMAIPHMLDDFTARDQRGSAKQEQFEQCEFFGGEGNYFLAAGGTATVTVQGQVGVAESGVAAMEAPPNQRPHSCQEFRQNKGFGEVVV